MSTYTVYIHIPYCKQKCRYCGFLSNLPENDEINRYVKAVKSEISMYRLFLSDRHVKSMYIGGGTPSLLNQEQLGELIESLRSNLLITDNVEATVELNPESVTREKLKALHGLGINRISIGVQSFDNKILNTLGRIHTVDEAANAIELSRSAGFKNINIDIIYGIPSQDIEKEFKGIREINPEHVSLYYLTIEQGTPLAVDKTFKQKMNDDIFEQLYTNIHNRLTDIGYVHYEVSNFAKEGFQSLHNNNYWERGDYLGIGSGAHGFFKTGLPWIGMTAQARYENSYPVSAYMSKLSNSSFPISRVETLDQDASTYEHIFLSLRTWKGVNLSLVKNKGLLKHLSEGGLVIINEGKLSLTVKGICVMDGIVTELF